MRCSVMIRPIRDDPWYHLQDYGWWAETGSGGAGSGGAGSGGAGSGGAGSGGAGYEPAPTTRDAANEGWRKGASWIARHALACTRFGIRLQPVPARGKCDRRGRR
jgi:hypothetical protein